MQATFGDQSFFAFNQSSSGYFNNPLPPRGTAPSFDQQHSMQYNQQAFSRSFGGNSMSGYNQSYFSQQMSRGSGGFNQSCHSSNSAAFNRQGMGGNMGYGFSQSGAMFNRGGFGFEQPPCGFTGHNNSSGGYWGQGGGSACRNGFMPGSQWSDSGVQNNKDTLNLGNYSMSLDKSDSSMILTNNQTGIQTKIWGDPHIDLNSGSANQSSGMFNGPLSFTLPDHTTVAVGTQPGAGGNVSYADNVTITNGNRAYVVNGLSENDSSPLTVQRSNNGFALAQQRQSGEMNLVSANGGTGWFNPQTHDLVKASDFTT